MRVEINRDFFESDLRKVGRKRFIDLHDIRMTKGDKVEITLNLKFNWDKTDPGILEGIAYRYKIKG